MDNEMMVMQGGRGDVMISREPEVVLAEAQKAAKALTQVLAAKPKKVMMGGKQYLEFEDWQTVARFYGVTAKVVSTEFIDYGGAQGFLARASAIRSDGCEISAAESMCLNDEEKWKGRAQYGYVLKDGTISVGEPEDKSMLTWEAGADGKRRPVRMKSEQVVPVPLFQLRSMAQTRACSKVLRNVLAWVVVLAGYGATPAEELDGKTDEQERKPPMPPQSTAGKPAGSTGAPAGAAAAGDPPANQVLTGIEKVESVEYTKADKKTKGTKYYVFAGEKYSTFSETISKNATRAAELGLVAKITFNQTKWGRDITAFEVQEQPEQREPGAEG